MKVKRSRKKHSRADQVFYVMNAIIMTALFVIYAWPLWFIVIASVSDPNYVTLGQVLIFPKGMHFGGYKLIAENQDIFRGYINSIFYTVVGTALNIVLTIGFYVSKICYHYAYYHYVFFRWTDSSFLTGKESGPI